MKHNIVQGSMLSLATAMILGTTGCGSSSSNSSSSPVVTDPVSSATKVVGGVVDLGTTANKASARKSLAKADAANDAASTAECGTAAEVQLYAIDDTDYAKPLLDAPVKVDKDDCTFNVTDEDFKDSNEAGVDKQYIVRTIVTVADNKFVELAAAKLKEGSDIGSVDPIATMIKERFEAVLEDVKSGMEKLTDLGVTAESIDTAIENIINDFEKNLDETVANLKQDIEDGKVEVNAKLFETTETLTTEATKEVKAAREAKEEEIFKTLKDSSVNVQFTSLDSSVKQQQLENIDETKLAESLKSSSIDASIAELKYSIIESFVKIGLPVHDGHGNIIVYMPVEDDKKGELPGSIFQIAYTDNGRTHILETNDDIRVINPKADLSNVSGNENWYTKYLDNAGPIIPNNVIDAMLINKDHAITMEVLGKALSKMDQKDPNVDAFANTGLYGVELSHDVETSVKKIVGVFEDKLIQNSFSMVLWESVDEILSNVDLSTEEGKNTLVEKMKALPFVMQNDEDVEAFKARLKTMPEISSYLVDNIGSSLATGIPLSDKSNAMLKFQDGVTISKDSTMKPLGSLAMINLFESTQMDDSEEMDDVYEYKAIALSDLFGEESELSFGDTKLWILDYVEPEETQGELKAPRRVTAQELSDQITEETKAVMILINTITGVNVTVEDSFADTMKALMEAEQVIEMKSEMMDDGFGFEDEFKEAMGDFGDGATSDASISLEIQDFNGESIELQEGESVVIAPVFENLETGEWQTIDSLEVPLHAVAQRYNSSTSFKIYNPEFTFDDNFEEDSNGDYMPTGNFDLIFKKSDGSSVPLATFPVFALDNVLDMPFFYDDEMMNDFISPDESGMGMGMFVEHNGFDTNGDVFFPQITKTDGVDVGENLFAYDFERHTFVPSLDHGVVSDATMRIVKVFDSYEDMDASEDVVENIVLDETVTSGAVFRLELSGPQIQTQTVVMNILDVYDTGSGYEVEYELFKENRFSEEMIVDVDMQYTDLTPELIEGKTFYLAKKTLSGEGSISTIQFNANGSAVETDEEETTEETLSYKIIDGELFIEDEDTHQVTLRALKNNPLGLDDVLVLEGYEEDQKIFDMVAFESKATRDAFIQNYQGDDVDKEDVEDALEEKSVPFAGTWVLGDNLEINLVIPDESSYFMAQSVKGEEDTAVAGGIELGDYVLNDKNELTEFIPGVNTNGTDTAEGATLVYNPDNDTMIVKSDEDESVILTRLEDKDQPWVGTFASINDKENDEEEGVTLLTLTANGTYMESDLSFNNNTMEDGKNSFEMGTYAIGDQEEDGSVIVSFTTNPDKDFNGEAGFSHDENGVKRTDPLKVTIDMSTYPVIQVNGMPFVRLDSETALVENEEQQQ